MITFIKDNTLASIKKKLIILYLLNVTDIIFTLLLLETGLFAEANILMIKVVEKPMISLCLKIVVPALLLHHLYAKIKESEVGALRVSNIAINISLSIYIFVNLSHIVWVSLLPVFM